MNSLTPGQSMSTRLNRRQALKTMAVASTAAVLPRRMTAETATQQVAGRDVGIQITVVSPHTFRFSVLPIEKGKPTFVPDDGSLVRSDWGAPLLTLRDAFKKQTPYNAPFAEAIETMQDFWNVPVYNELLAATQKYIGMAVDGEMPTMEALHKLAEEKERTILAALATG